MKRKKRIVLILVLILAVLSIIFIFNTTKAKGIFEVEKGKIQSASNSITYTQNNAAKRSKEEIIEKYEDIKTIYDYENEETLYLEEPSDKSPYVAGSLKEDVINDTLNRINFYRWLYGIEDLTLNRSRMERNQKGAVLLSRLGYIDHNPSNPGDMESNFFDEALLACKSNSSLDDSFYAAIASGNQRPYQAIDGFINEIYNNLDGIGHRLNVLDPYVTKASFGQCTSFSTLSLYFDYSNKDTPIETENEFYAMPNAGAFPAELFKTNEYLHIYTTDTEDKTLTNITVKYNGQTYTVTDKNETTDHKHEVFYFRLPNQVIELLGGANKKIPYDTKLEVTINCTSSSSKNITYEYPIEFFRLIPEEKIKVTISKPSTSIEMGKTEKLEVTTEPKEAIKSGVTWASKNEKIAKVDTEGNITPVFPGTTKITATVDGVTAACEVTITGDKPFIKGDVDEDGDITLIDCDKVLAHVRGTALLDGVPLQKADVDGDGDVTLLDCGKLLAHVRGTKFLESE